MVDDVCDWLQTPPYPGIRIRAYRLSADRTAAGVRHLLADRHRVVCWNRIQIVIFAVHRRRQSLLWADRIYAVCVFAGAYMAGKGKRSGGDRTATVLPVSEDQQAEQSQGLVDAAACRLRGVPDVRHGYLLSRNDDSDLRELQHHSLQALEKDPAGSTVCASVHCIYAHICDV